MKRHCDYGVYCRRIDAHQVVHFHPESDFGNSLDTLQKCTHEIITFKFQDFLI